MLDIAGSRSFSSMRGVLTPDATVVLVGGRMTYAGSARCPTSADDPRALPQPEGDVLRREDHTEDLTLLGLCSRAGDAERWIDRKYRAERSAQYIAPTSERGTRGRRS